MNKDIPLTGYTTSPSDRQCSDGELSCSYNLINEDGALSPIMEPVEVCSRAVPGIVRGFIHTVEGGKRKNLVAIVKEGDTWRARFYVGVGPYLDNKGGGTDISGCLRGPTISLLGDVSIAAVGSTLVLTSQYERRFVLWRVGESVGGYVDLGNDIPNPSLSIRLYSPCDVSGNFIYSKPEDAADRDVTLNYTCDYGSEDFYKKENQMAIHSAVSAMCNKLIAECNSKGRFMFPFLVRYAWRLFDGTLTKHSAPILMLPSTRIAPIIALSDHVEGSRRTETCTPTAIMSQLMYQIVTPDPFTLEDWKDIVTSLEIYVSAPIYSYRQNIDSFEDEDFSKYAPHTNVTTPPDSFSLSYNGNTCQCWNYAALANWFILPQRYSAKEIQQRIQDCSTFYHLCTIDSESFGRSYRNARVLTRDDVGNLENLVSRETMTDDYDSRDSIRGKKAFAYNNRISIVDISKTLYSGGDPHDLSSPVYDFTNDYDYQVFFFVKTSSGVSVVTSGIESDVAAMVPYLYYPNMGCYKAVIKRTSGGTTQFMEVQMRPHMYLNGSVWVGDTDFLLYPMGRGANIGGIIPPWWVNASGSYQGLAASNTDVDLPNKIYTSEVDNPFVTLVSGIATVGQGRILGVSTAAKALSQGQFGQFPLYAFCTDGVWALSVSDKGGFSSVQPITQDVCTNAESITQLDSSVVFVTRRGLMQLSGSTVQCLTDNVSSEDPFDLGTLPGMQQLHILLGHTDGDTCLPTKPFNEYLSNAVIVYDYLHQRLYLGNPECKYTYVYSLKSNMWGWYSGSIAIALNSYPQALAFLDKDDTSKIYDFSCDGAEDERALRPGLAVTRPIKLGEGDTFKTMDAVYFRGLFRPTNIGVVLWGSRDLEHWNLIASSDKYYLEGMRGEGYKYFRIGAKTSMPRSGRLTGMSVEYRTKLGNRIR